MCFKHLVEEHLVIFDELFDFGIHIGVDILQLYFTDESDAGIVCVHVGC